MQQGFWRLGRGAFGLQVLMLVLMMLVGTSADIHAQEYITDVMTLGADNGTDAKNLRNEYTNKGWKVLKPADYRQRIAEKVKAMNNKY